MGMILLEEVQKRTGYSPAAIRTRVCRGSPLPFPIYKDPIDGQWKVDEADIEAWAQKLKASGAAATAPKAK